MKDIKLTDVKNAIEDIKDIRTYWRAKYLLSLYTRSCYKVN